MILIDLNVIVDVTLRRSPHFASSLVVVNRVVQGRLPAAMAAHNITTLDYVMTRYANAEAAKRLVDWALAVFEIVPVGPHELRRAQALNWPDFEDAVVAAAAETAGCTTIVTRNVRDFRGSVVPAVLPEELVINEVHESFVRRYGDKDGARRAGTDSAG